MFPQTPQVITEESCPPITSTRGESSIHLYCSQASSDDLAVDKNNKIDSVRDVFVKHDLGGHYKYTGKNYHNEIWSHYQTILRHHYDDRNHKDNITERLGKGGKLTWIKGLSSSSSTDVHFLVKTIEKVS